MRAEHFDREERDRVRNLAKEAKANRLVIRETKAKARGYSFRQQLSAGVLGIRDSFTLGDMIAHKRERRAEFLAMQGTPVVHVKNGKPLTAKGAAMLGVPWDGGQ